MPTPTRGPRLGGSPAHERLMLANLATALFEHGQIRTTVTRAKRLRPLAERMVTFAKRGDLHARRQVLTVVRDPDVVHRLFHEIGPSYAERPGGYTRITRVGPRKGDNAAMAVISLVEARTIAQEAVGEAERARGTRFARRAAAPPPPATPVPGEGGPATPPAGNAEQTAGAPEAPAEVPAASAPEASAQASELEASPTDPAPGAAASGTAVPLDDAAGAGSEPGNDAG